MTEKQAYKKSVEILRFCQDFVAKQEQGKELRNLELLDLVEKKFKGETYNTGGHCYVCYIRLAPHWFVGVSDELVCLYKSKAYTKNIDDVYQSSWDEQCENEIEAFSIYESDDFRSTI